MYGPILAASPRALELAAEWEKAGPLNPVLRAIDVYYGPDDDLPDPAAELAEAELAERDGRVGDALLDLLPPLCAARLEYVADFRVDNRKYTALAASTGTAAAFAVRERDLDADTDLVRFREIGVDELLGALLDLLNLEPGTGRLVSVAVAEARQQRDAATDQAPSQQLTELRALLARPVVGPAIEVAVGIRDGMGKHHYTHKPLHIAALDWGHFLTYNVGEGRDERFYGGPATREYIREALATLRATLPGQ
ncbi:MAG: hypothetical protein GEV04_08835 [Actinophytocola sp.]|nr:hypothetical protein [Actinophytocola sp.]